MGVFFLLVEGLEAYEGEERKKTVRWTVFSSEV